MGIWGYIYSKANTPADIPIWALLCSAQTAYPYHGAAGAKMLQCIECTAMNVTQPLLTNFWNIQITLPLRNGQLISISWQTSKPLLNRRAGSARSARIQRMVAMSYFYPHDYDKSRTPDFYTLAHTSHSTVGKNLLAKDARKIGTGLLVGSKNAITDKMQFTDVCTFSTLPTDSVTQTS